MGKCSSIWGGKQLRKFGIHAFSDCNILYDNFPQTNTFQGILATDFSRSFAVFTYYCGDLDFSNGANIGFVTTDGLFANHKATLRGEPMYVACLNYPVSPWVNVVYEITGNVLVLIYREAKIICVSKITVQAGLVV